MLVSFLRFGTVGSSHDDHTATYTYPLQSQAPATGGPNKFPKTAFSWPGLYGYFQLSAHSLSGRPAHSKRPLRPVFYATFSPPPTDSCPKVRVSHENRAPIIGG